MSAVLKKLSRALRSNSTEAEKKLWHRLRRRQLKGWKFRRQYPVDNYIADFICLEKRLIVEVDGGQHAHSHTDEERTRILESKGFLVVRFWNNQVSENMEGVLQTIINTVNPLPDPPPLGEGRTGET